METPFRNPRVPGAHAVFSLIEPNDTRPSSDWPRAGGHHNSSHAEREGDNRIELVKNLLFICDIYCLSEVDSSHCDVVLKPHPSLAERAEPNTCC